MGVSAFQTCSYGRTSVWLAEHREDGGRRQELEVEKPVKAQSPAREERCRKELEQRVAGARESQVGKLGPDLYAVGHRVHKQALKSKAAP